MPQDALTDYFYDVVPYGSGTSVRVYDLHCTFYGRSDERSSLIRLAERYCERLLGGRLRPISPLVPSPAPDTWLEDGWIIEVGNE